MTKSVYHRGTRNSRGMRAVAWIFPWALVLCAVLAAPVAGVEYAMETGWNIFPVFDDPPMLSAAEAEQARVIFPRDAVIGVAYGGEAKAYPIAIMGIHELGNDTIGGKPIAISW